MEGRSVGELLALVTYGRAGGDLLERMGGLERLARADPFEIADNLGASRGGARPPHARARARAGPSPALGPAQALAAAFELGRRVELARARSLQRLGSPADVVAWATPRLGTLTHEELWVLGLDGRGHLRGARCVAKGGLHGAAVRASDTLRAALRLDASAFVLVHNHPSGDPTPSKEDVALTAQIAAASSVIGVPLLDHIVVARGTFASVGVPPDGAEPRGLSG